MGIELITFTTCRLAFTFYLCNFTPILASSIVNPRNLVEDKPLEGFKSVHSYVKVKSRLQPKG